MAQKITPKTHQQAHNFRHVPTPGESKLWSYLRAHRFKNVHFRRQHPIGKYIVDICAPREKLIIEIDGSAHLQEEAKDKERSIYLTSRGYMVIRFWNNDIINNVERVMIKIENALNALHPSDTIKDG
jgi:very-short-patch-repair endonuclease